MGTPATTPSGTTAPTCSRPGRAKPASVNLALAAVDHFYRFVGLGPANTRREQLPQAAPRALDVDQTRRLLRAAERTATGPGGVRDRAIVTVLLFTGLRIAELVALDTGDLSISARKGQLTVRRGKGERYRQVPVNAEARTVLDTWLAARRSHRVPHLMTTHRDDTSRRARGKPSRRASGSSAPAGSRHPAPRGDILRKVTRAPARVLPLVDGFGRAATDLRVSLTDRCNLRCTYCMPAEGLPWLPSPELLTDDELVRLIGIATERLGVTEVRLTGGEPTLRPTLVSLVSRLAALPQRPQLSLTTNGLTLPRLAEPLAAAGLDRVNVSLDTTDPETFRRITRRDRLDDVIAGLAAAAKAGLLPVKVNAVLLRGVNDDHVVDLLTWCRERGYQLRIIEQMPLDAQHGWDRNQMVTAAETRTRLSAAHVLTPVPGRGSAPAETFLVDGGPDTVGIIASVTEPFCAACDRVRLTADGQVRDCLFARTESDLRTALRAGADDDELATRLLKAVAGKRAGHGIDDPSFAQPARSMSAIGG